MSDKKIIKTFPSDNPPFQRYDYFSKPDGEEVLQKLWAVIQPATVAALSLSTIDVMLLSKPQGYANILARYAYVSFPVLGCSVAFVLTSNMAAAIRKKPDRINWALGGAAAGSMMGVWRRSQPVGWFFAGAFGFAAYMKKYAVDSNYTIIPQSRSCFTLKSGGYDYTLSKNIPGNYTIDPPK